MFVDDDILIVDDFRLKGVMGLRDGEELVAGCFFLHGQILLVDICCLSPRMKSIFGERVFVLFVVALLGMQCLLGWRRRFQLGGAPSYAR